MERMSSIILLISACIFFQFSLKVASGSVMLRNDKNHIKEILGGIGRKLRRLRLAKGWTQEEIEDRFGFSYRYYGKLERGEINPTIGTLARLAEIFEIPLTDLLESDLAGKPLSEEAESVLMAVKRVIARDDRQALRKLGVFLREII
jgi:transcriptional regulator with XRE-family HTH domain